jgi:hypothetical protein
MRIGKVKTGYVTTESGYIDFTGGSEAGCSYQISTRVTLGGAVQHTSSHVRDPYGLSYEEQLSGQPFDRLDTWYAVGYPRDAIGDGPLPVPGIGYGFDAQPAGTNQGAGLCRFTDVANYTTLVPGTDRLRVNLAHYDAIIKKASRYNMALLVNALDLPNEASASASAALLYDLATPTISSIFTNMEWHLSKSRGVVTFSVTPTPLGEVPGHLAIVVTFTPTRVQIVPSVHGVGPVAQIITSLGGKKNFFKSLLKMEGTTLTATPATLAVKIVATYAVITSDTAVTLPKLKTAIGTADGGVSLVKTKTSGRAVTWAEMRVKTAPGSYSDVCVKFGLKAGTTPEVVGC